MCCGASCVLSTCHALVSRSRRTVRSAHLLALYCFGCFRGISLDASRPLQLPPTNARLPTNGATEETTCQGYRTIIRHSCYYLIFTKNLYTHNKFCLFLHYAKCELNVFTVNQRRRIVPIISSNIIFWNSTSELSVTVSLKPRNVFELISDRIKKNYWQSGTPVLIIFSPWKHVLLTTDSVVPAKCNFL